MVIDLKDADSKYLQIMRRARDRGVDWQMSFEEWMTVWLESGHWLQRGKGRGRYNMSRINDTGPYAVDNVFIQLHEENARDGHKGKPKSPEHLAAAVAARIGVKYSEQARKNFSLGQQRRRARERQEAE
jgi:hypothetical protein